MYAVTASDLDTFLSWQLTELPAHIPHLHSAYDLMYLTGCRAQESVRLGLWHIRPGIGIIMHPLKDNNDRRFSLSELPSDLLYWIASSIEYNRFVNYRRLQYHFNMLIGQYGIMVGDKLSLLHLFRHNYVKKLVANGLTETEIKVKMGHKDIDNTRNYINSVILSTLPLPV